MAMCQRFRVTERPFGTEPPRAIMWALALGFVACAVLVVVLVVTSS
jgi:hypothetical protein